MCRQEYIARRLMCCRFSNHQVSLHWMESSHRRIVDKSFSGHKKWSKTCHFSWSSEMEMKRMKMKWREMLTLLNFFESMNCTHSFRRCLSQICSNSIAAPWALCSVSRFKHSVTSELNVEDILQFKPEFYSDIALFAFGNRSCVGEGGYCIEINVHANANGIEHKLHRIVTAFQVPCMKCQMYSNWQPTIHSCVFDGVRLCIHYRSLCAFEWWMSSFKSTHSLFSSLNF